MEIATPSAAPDAPPTTSRALGSSSGAPRPGRPEAAAAIWRWREVGGEGDRGEAARQRRRGVIQALVGAVAGVAVFFFWRREAAFVVWAVSAVTLALALASPLGAYAALGRGLARFSHWVGRALAWVLFVPVFFLFFTLFGRLLRSGRRDRLERWFDRRAPSYWKQRPDGERTLADYRRQF
jgi:hypothetical protein